MLSENFYLAITQGNTSGENVSVCFKNGNGMGFCFISKGHYHVHLKLDIHKMQKKNTQ